MSFLARTSSHPAEEAAPASPPPATDTDDASFEALGVSPDLVSVLVSRGITVPFPVQALTIADAMAGRDVCGKAQTGSGKTLAFGLPLVERTSTARPRYPRSLVLVPTRELANQVAEELTPLAATRGLWLTAIYGGMSMGRQIAALRAGVDIVIATPGRLNDLLEREAISVAEVEFVVLDEADQMADMGFLPQVERILSQIEGQPQTLLFSATLDGAIGKLVQRYQHEPVHHEVAASSTTVDTLEQRFIGVRSDEKVEVAARICAGASRALLFVRTTHGADRLARDLGRAGLSAEPIHGRLSQSKRERALAAFARGASPVLVATNVAARGLHVDGIDVVIHYDPPEDDKTYLHRSGRTARAGEDGLVVSLVLPEQERDITTLQRNAGLDFAVVAMRPDDARLDDLVAWEPPRRPAQAIAKRSGSPAGRPRGGVTRGSRNTRRW